MKRAARVCVLTQLAIAFAVFSPGLFVVALGQQAAIPVLEGLDPVMLVQGKEVQGDPKISVTRGRFQYLFSSEENKATFEREPERYAIQLRGACARMGAPVIGNPDLWTVHDGRVYVFGSEDCVKNFRAAPGKYMEPTPAGWSAKQGEERKGRKLIERAVKALGGAARVDSLSSYQEEQVMQVNTPRGEMAFRTVTRMAFAGGAEGEKKNRTGYKPVLRVRIEESNPMFSFTRVRAGGEAFALLRRGPQPLAEPQRNYLDAQLRRQLVVLLRGRKSNEFRAAAMGNAEVDGTRVEQVLIDFEGTRMTLRIEQKTGRVHSMFYVGRAPQPSGEVGEIVQAFSDFRSVDGLTLPFQVKSTFRGEAVPSLSPKVESIRVNPALDPVLFEKPKAAGT